MSEQEILDLKHAIDGFDRELDFRAKQIDELRVDLQLLIRFSGEAQNSIIGIASGGNPQFDAETVKRCKEFVEKYELRIGG